MEAKLFIFAAVAISEVFSACSPSNTILVNFLKTPKRSLPFEVSVSTKRCPSLHEIYFRWKVYENDEKGRILQSSSKPTITINGYDYDSKTCFITNYLLTVAVSHFTDMSSADHAFGTFTFVPDEMYIEIEGGVHRPFKITKDLVVDAEKLSEDLSYPPGEDAFAGNIVQWKVQPPSEVFNLSDSLVQTIPKKYLNVDEVYLFKVTVTRTKIPGYENIKTADQVITIVDEDFPEVNVRCFRNCKLPNYRESTVFIAECVSMCEDLTYNWKVVPALNDSMLEFGNGYDKIKIKPNAFMEGVEVFVTFSVGFIPVISSLTFAKGLEKGNCTIDPDTGISGVTRFKINCTGFYSPYGLSLSMVYHAYDESDKKIEDYKLYNGKVHSDKVHIKKVLLYEYNFKEVAEIYLPPGNPVTLTVVVEDNAFLQAQVQLNARVEQYQPEENIQIEAGLKQRVLSRDFTSITSYSFEGLNNEVVQLTDCVLEAIKYYKLDEAIAKDLHKHMVEAIMRSKPARLNSVIQRLLILKKLLRSKAETDSLSIKLLGEAFRGDILELHLMHVHQQNIPWPDFYMSILFDLTVHISSDMLEKSDVVLGVLNEEIAPHNYDSYDEFVRQKVQIRDDYRSLTSNIFIALETYCLTYLFKAVPDEAQIFHETELMVLQTRRKLLNSNENHEFILSFFKWNQTKVILPPALIQDLQKNYTFIDYQFAVFLKNPFWWHRNVSALNTRVILFDLFLRCEKIKKLTSPFLLHLEILSAPKEMVEGTLSKEIVAAYKIELESHVTLVIDFFNVGEHPNDYLVTWSNCVCTEDDFVSTRSKVITSKDTSRVMRVENNLGKKLIYLCIKKSTPILSYRFALATFSCMYWNLKHKAFEKGGCRVIDPFLNMKGYMICECNHVSLFTGEIMAPPTTVLVNLEINCTIGSGKNYVMVAFITGLLFLWLVFLLFAHLRDKSMKKKNVVYKLDDNVPGDSNPYLIVVFTGIFYDAQTTADVSLKLIGKLSRSRTHVIKCQGVTLLKRNSQDWFMIYTPYPLGKIKKIQVWHNCKGGYPHWYCDRIIVQDMKIGEQYCFTVKKWFSVIWGTGKIFREIPATKTKKDTVDVLFRTQFEKDMKDTHLWLSIVTRDIQSNFNSKERVSTGFCFLFLSMLANALLYRFPEGIPADSIDQQTNFDIAFTNFVVFMESWLAAIPVSYVIYFFFNNSAPI